MSIQELQNELTRLSDLINDAAQNGKSQVALREHFAEAGKKLAKEIDDKALVDLRETTKALHRKWFNAEYRNYAFLNAAKRYISLQQQSASDAASLAKQQTDESIAMFYRRAEQIHNENATALTSMINRCEDLKIIEE